jgi:protease-4
MASLAASGGYYISASADRIVAQPGTITGSIGVLTGKVSFGKTLELIGAKAETVGVGKNTLMDSPFQPFTADQWANLNRQADVIYDDFTQKVADGRKMPLAKVRDAARGRVWSGTDAKAQGLVDALGGFWTAAQTAASLASVPSDRMTFSIYPRPTGLLSRLGALSDGLEASIGLMGRVESLLNFPALQAVLGQVSGLPDGSPGSTLQLKAAHLPRP